MIRRLDSGQDLRGRIFTFRHTIPHYILIPMRVTALIPDDLINDVRRFSGAKTITESLLIALGEWTNQQKLKSLREKVASKPLRFREGFTAEHIRRANRN